VSEINYFQHSLYIPPEKLSITEAEGTYALREGWKKLYKKYPSDNSLAILWAQVVLETGRFKVGFHNGNFGNIKKRWPNPKYGITDDGHYFTMFRAGEVLNGRHQMFDPPHKQTHFRAYESIIDGAEDYIKFVSQKARYKKAWAELIKGDPKAYSHELKVAGYYTANEERYTNGVVRLFEEFLKRKEELLTLDESSKAKIFKSLLIDEEVDIETIPVLPSQKDPEPTVVVIPKLPALPKDLIEPEEPKVVVEKKPEPKKTNRNIVTVVVLGAIAWVVTTWNSCSWW